MTRTVVRAVFWTSAGLVLAGIASVTPVDAAVTGTGAVDDFYTVCLGRATNRLHVLDNDHGRHLRIVGVLPDSPTHEPRISRNGRVVIDETTRRFRGGAVYYTIEGRDGVTSSAWANTQGYEACP